MKNKNVISWLNKIIKPLLGIVLIAGIIYWMKFKPINVVEYK